MSRTATVCLLVLTCLLGHIRVTLVEAQPVVLQPPVDPSFQPPVENPEDQQDPMNEADFAALMTTLLKDKTQAQETIEINEVYPTAVEIKQKQAKRLETVKERVAALSDKDANKRDEMIHSMLHELVGVAHDAAQGLRFEDNHYLISPKGGKITDEYEYWDGKGNFTSTPPKGDDYVAKLTRLLKLISTLYCDASSANAKDAANPIHSFCKLSKDLFETIQKVASSPGFSAQDGLNALRNVLKNSKTKYTDILKVVDDPLLNSNAFVEEQAGIKAASKYKIAPLGSHHESIACQALRPANLGLGGDPTFTGPAATAGGKTMVPIFDETVGAHTWCDWGVAPSTRFWDANANNLYYLKLGARWQDVPCHGSDALVFRDGFVDTCYARGVPAAAAGIAIPRWVPLLHNALAIESHERSKTYYHSMASVQSIANLPPGPKDQAAFREVIIAQAEAWLNQAVNYQRGQGGKPKANAFHQKRFFWNLGRTCHMIADSYSCAHVARAAITHQVLWFQDYVYQNHGNHGTHDSQPTPGVSAGTVKALQDCIAIAQIYAAAARDHLDNVGGAIPNAQNALRNFLTNHVYMFYPGQDAVPAASCCVHSTCKPGGKQCPKPAALPPAPYNVCADNPTDINVELA